MSIELLNVNEVAEILRVSCHRVYQLAREGRMAGAIRIGRQVRFDRNRLSDWLEAGGEALPGGWRREARRPNRSGYCKDSAERTSKLNGGRKA